MLPGAADIESKVTSSGIREITSPREPKERMMHERRPATKRNTCAVALAAAGAAASVSLSSIGQRAIETASKPRTILESRRRVERSRCVPMAALCAVVPLLLIADEFVADAALEEAVDAEIAAVRIADVV